MSSNLPGALHCVHPLILQAFLANSSATQEPANAPPTSVLDSFNGLLKFLDPLGWSSGLTQQPLSLILPDLVDAAVACCVPEISIHFYWYLAQNQNCYI